MQNSTPSNLREAAQMSLVALIAMQSEAKARGCGLRICDDAIVTMTAALALPDEPVAYFTGFYAAPQPAPVERKPLTNNEIHLAMDAAGIEANGMPFSKELQIARVIEALHGIKSAA